MQIWIHDSKMKKIVALNNDIPDMMSYTNSSWHSYLDQATSTFDFTIPKFSNGELHEDLKLINDECFVSFYVNGSYQVFYIATLQEDDFNIQLTCNNTNLEYALEYANPFSSESAQSIKWYLEHMDLLAFAAVEIGNNEISDRKRTLTFDSQETKMNRLQSLMSKFEAEFEFKVELNRDGTYKRIVINIYQENHIGTDRKDVVLYYSNGLKGVQVTSDKTQMFNAGVFTGKDGLSLNDVEISEKNADGIEEFYSRKGNPCLYAPIAMNRYPATMRAEGQDNWIRKDFTTEYENVNDLKAYALRTLKQYAYPLITYTASVQSGFVSQYTDLKLGDTIRIIDKNFVGGLALEARVSEMIISFDNPANNSFVFTNYRKLDNKPSSALQTRIEEVIESRLHYRIELATTGGVTFKNNEGETIIKPSLYKGNLPWTKDVTWHWTLNSIVTDGMQYRIQARDITDTAVLTVDAFVGGKKVATTEITLTNVNDGSQGPQGPQGDEGPQGPQGDDGPKGDKGDTGNGIANTVVTYGLSVSDTTEPATWSSSVPTLVKGMYLWTRTVIIYTNGESTTSYQISYIPKDGDASGEIDKTKQELLEKLGTVRDESLAAVDAAKQDLTNVASELNTAKQDLTSHAQQLQTQANAQTELTKRVTTVETTANGTKTTVSELSKTVDSNTKNITSVTARTKVVEDDLSGTKTTLSQVKMTADSASQKTATLETGLNGLSAKFSNLKIGGRNLLTKTNQGKTNWDWSISDGGTTAEDYYVGSVNAVKLTRTADAPASWAYVQYQGLLKNLIEPSTEYTLSFDVYPSQNVTFTATLKQGNSADPFTNDVAMNQALANKWTKVFCTLTSKETLPSPSRQVVYLSGMPVAQGNYLIIKNIKLEKGNVATDYSPSEVDFEQKVAEYKQDADQNYASLQNTVQALDGTVKQNKSEFDQTASQIKSSISAVESKIPTAVGGRNLLAKTNQGKTNWEWAISSGWVTAEDYNVDGVNAVKLTRTADVSASWSFIQYRGLIRKLIEPDTKYTLSFDVKPSVDVTFSASLKRGDGGAPLTNAASMNKALANKWTKASCVLTSNTALPDDLSQVVYLQGMPIANGNWLIIKNIKLEKGVVPSDWSPAPEDTANQISNLSSEIKQTADGITLLATKTELNSAKNELQSGIKTATDKANNAQFTANNNAQTITTHTSQISALNTGLQAKVSQSDFNTLSGRVTTAENNITAKANELSSKITKVEGKIPTSSGGRNLAQGTSKDWSNPFTGFWGGQNTCPNLYKVTTDGLSVGDTFKTRIVLKYTNIVPASGKTAEIWLQGAGNVTAWNSGAYPSGGGGNRSISGSGEIVFELTDKINADHLKNSYWNLSFRTDWIASGSLQWKLAKAERGMFFTDWSPAPEDTISQISSLSSEFKQTTDSIKASVTSLNNSTVKSSSLTINSDGIVMKAGKSTTDVANAIGSYFAVNQNAINLFSDKINVKGNMIVNGTITGDKIAASSVDVSKIVGIDANFIKSKIEYAMIDWLKGKSITAYNGNMTIDLQNGRISFKDGSNAVYRQTSDGIHTGFLHFEAGSLGGIYAAFGATSTRQGINSKSSEFAGIRCYRVSKNGDSHDAKIDKIEVVGDTVQFGHGYRSDGSIGGGFIMDTAAFANETPYSFNRIIKSIEALWRILYDHARNTGYRFNDSAFINALSNEYRTWHDMRNQ